MGPGITLAQIVAIVGGDQGQIELTSELGQRLVGEGLLGQTVGLEFQIEIVRPEDLGVFQGHLARVLFLIAHEQGGDFPLEAAREPDQTLVVLPQDLLVDPGLVVKAFKIGQGNQLHQVLVAGEVLCQQHQVIVAIVIAVAAAAPFSLTFKAAPGSNVDLATENGLDLEFPAQLVEFQRPEHVAMIGNGHCRHLVSCGPCR